MESGTKSTLITIATALATLFAAISMHGDGVLKALGGVPALMSAWSAQLPLGVGSFFLALTLSTLVWLVAIVKLKPGAMGRRHLSADTIALCVAATVILSQQALAARGVGAILNALFVAAVAGLLAPYIGKGLRAIFVRAPKCGSP